MHERLRRLGAALTVFAAVAGVVATAGPAAAAGVPAGGAAGPARAAGPAGGAAGPAAGPVVGAACSGPRVLSITGSRVVEGSTRGTLTSASFTVTSTGCALEGTVRFATVAYTAGKDDFVARTASVAYRAGDSGARSVVVQVIPDLLPESNECFAGMLAAPSANVRIAAGGDQAAMIILDDDTKRAAGGFICSE
ncbi:MAG TPA: hypothetical protein VLM05_20645 [Mycobacteriales bacterium]|nr:hypothetical protein [Mycobacteriales bacterium]